MPHIALASELHRLSPDQIARVDHIILDDGDWSPEQIAHYIAQWYGLCVVQPAIDDWSQYNGPLL